MLGTDVLGDGVTTPGAATQGQGRGQREVVQVTDTTLGGGGVDEDTGGLHLVAEVLDAVGIAILVGIETGGVADTTDVDHVAGHFDGFFEVLGTEHTQRWREFLVSELVFRAEFQTFTDEDLGGGRHGHTGHGGDLGGRLAHDVGVQGAVDQQHFTHLVRFVLGEDVAGVGRETLLDLVVDGVDHDDSLLGGTDHAVVEGLGHQDGGDGTLHVGGFVDDDGHVARTHADGGFAGGVGGLHHARATGGQDQVDVVVTHQGIGEFDGGLINPADDVFRRTGSHGCIQYQLGSGIGGVLGTGVRGEDDGVAGLQGDEGLEDRGGSRVGGRYDTADDAYRLGDGDGAHLVVLAQDAAGLFIFIGVVDVFGGEVVLDNLVFDDTHTGFSHGHLGQGDTGVAGGQGGGTEDLVYLLLREAGELTLCFFDAGNQCIQFSQIGYCHVYLLMI